MPADRSVLAIASSAPVAAGRGAPPVYGALAAVWLGIALLYSGHGLTLDAFDFAAVGALFLFALGVAASLRQRGLGTSATAVEACTLHAAACLSFTLLSLGAASFSLPLQDQLLARADRLLLPGVDWTRAIPAIASRDTLAMRLANVAYGALAWEPTLVIAALCALRQQARCWRFVYCWIATLAIVVGIFAVMPALGPYPHYAIPAAHVPGVHARLGWHAPEIVAALRSGSLRHISAGSLDGLIAFPSFHAAGGLLLMRALWFHRAWRLPSALLNGAMILSAIPIGGHYFIDIVGGLGAAALGTHLAARPRLARRDAAAVARATAARAPGPAWHKRRNAAAPIRSDGVSRDSRTSSA